MCFIMCVFCVCICFYFPFSPSFHEFGSFRLCVCVCVCVSVCVCICVYMNAQAPLTQPVLFHGLKTKCLHVTIIFVMLGCVQIFNLFSSVIVSTKFVIQNLGLCVFPVCFPKQLCLVSKYTHR